VLLEVGLLSLGGLSGVIAFVASDWVVVFVSSAAFFFFALKLGRYLCE